MSPQIFASILEVLGNAGRIDLALGGKYATESAPEPSPIFFVISLPMQAGLNRRPIPLHLDDEGGGVGSMLSSPVGKASRIASIMPSVSIMG